MTDNYKAKLRKFFRVMDTNHDGFVSHTEFVEGTKQRATKRLGSDKGVKFGELFETCWGKYWLPEADKKVDGDTLVSVDAFIGYIDLRDEEGRKGVRDVSEFFFDAIDLDKNGTISLNELEEFFKILNLKDDVADKAFDLLDTDHDKKITRKEYIDGIVGYFCDDGTEYNLLLGDLNA